MEVQNPPSPILSTTRILSSAEILDLINTPIEIIPAPGVNELIVPLGVAAVYLFNSIQYASANDVLRFYYDGGNGTQLSTSIAGIVVGASSGHGYVAGTLTGAAQYGADKGKNFALSINDAYTTGNGTLAITTFYQVVSP